MPYSCGLDDRHRTVRDPAPAGTGSGTGGSLRYAILFGPWVAQVGLVRATSSFIRSPTYVHRYATTSRFCDGDPEYTMTRSDIEDFVGFAAFAEFGSHNLGGSMHQ